VRRASDRWEHLVPGIRAAAPVGVAEPMVVTLALAAGVAAAVRAVS
jgi:hypothetical protein